MQKSSGRNSQLFVMEFRESVSLFRPYSRRPGYPKDYDDTANNC